MASTPTFCSMSSRGPSRRPAEADHGRSLVTGGSAASAHGSARTSGRQRPIGRPGVVTGPVAARRSRHYLARMPPLSYARHQFPTAIIQHAIWLHLRFTLSYRDVEELLAERGVDVSYESVRRWVLKFGPAIAGNLRRLRPKPSPRWHLDEMVIRVSGKLMHLWQAVDDEGEVLEMLVQRRRDKAAALKLMRKLLKKHGFAPTEVTTDDLRPKFSPVMGRVSVSCDAPSGQ
ncbi:IS6 family transposase [Azospirillum brasilense]|uniref:IS6 family transposase n=1 Tax=Azospirillum brasilense TaxID=192 RepID=A0A6L3AZG8_AZOBR|nr:IS6 family transposase [Azospirillum brasilense]